MRQGNVFGVVVAAIGLLILRNYCFADDQPPTTTQAPSTTQPAEPEFDSSAFLTGDWFGARKQLAAHGIHIEPDLIVDYSKNFMGGVDTAGDSFRERFNLPIEIDTEPLFAWHGGKFVAVYQLQHGGNASHTLTGDAQNFAFGTDADGRSQLGKLYYQQSFADDTMRIRAGKLDGNDDFDVLLNGVSFLNNSFSTSPTLGLMPSFPDTGMGIEYFYEPPSGFYAGAGVFDGSMARGVRTGEYGPSHFFDRGDNLFLIAETGKNYKLATLRGDLPGKIGLGTWWDTNPFDRLDGNGQKTGTGGVYLTLDQTLVMPPASQTNSSGRIDSCFTVGWCDPIVNRIDGNALAGLTETGPLPSRPNDIAGAGATWAHFSADAGTRDPFELAIELFYRIQITDSVTLEPDLQYIIHPSGSGQLGEPIRNDALVATLRLHIAF